MRLFFLMIHCLPFFFVQASASCEQQLFQLTHVEAEVLAERIWYNESDHQPQRLDFLTFWNEVEPFPSLGMGHFIWPPKSYSGPFTEKFYTFIKFCLECQVDVPSFLVDAKVCLWDTREAFYEAFESYEMQQLRHFLDTSRPYQALFLVEWLQEYYQSIQEEAVVREHFDLVAKHSLFPLVDYLNFKRAGGEPVEGYGTAQWGLTDVLRSMDQELAKKNPIQAFQIAAKRCLTQRVSQAPDIDAEMKWLPNWFERIDLYQN